MLATILIVPKKWSARFINKETVNNQISKKNTTNPKQAFYNIITIRRVAASFMNCQFYKAYSANILKKKVE